MLIAHEDHVSLDSTTLSITKGSLASGTLDSLKTRQLAETATISRSGASFIVRATFDQDRDVRVVAILNYGRTGAAPQIFTLRDSSLSTIVSEAGLDAAMDTDIYTINYFKDFGQTYSNVRAVDYEVAVGGDAPLGRLWAGPAFAPDNVQAFGFGFGVADPSSVSTSRGGQAYADPYNRLRTLRATLPALTETEAFGDATDSSVTNIQDMLFTVGKHRELIIIPYEGDDSLVHKWGMYGHLTGYSNIVPVRPGDGSNTTRLFEVSLEAIEER